MGCLNSDQTQVPNPDEEEAEDGVETLSLCDLPLYGDDDDVAVKCDGGRSSTSSEEEHDRELFEFSSGELGSTPILESEKIVFCGRIIHFQERPPPTLCVVKSPGKDCPKKKNRNTTMMTHSMKRRRLFCWKLRLFRKTRTSYRMMKAEDEDNSDFLGWKQQQQRRRPRQRTYSWGWSGKWYFLMFGSAKFPVEMGLRDIKSRQSRRSNPSNLFRLSDYAEAEVGDNERAQSRRNSWGLLNILRCSNRGNGHDHSHRNDVIKVSNGCFPSR